jgi:predicted enzyme related to lactoylglutathione lyase
VPVRLTTITLPLGDRLDLAEYGGVTRKPIGARIQDPGATRFQLHVKDVREAAELAKKAGATIVSQDGGIIELAGGAMATVARDPNNLFLVLISSVQ